MDGDWYGARADVIYNMIKDMKNKGCHIHGVGFQLHVGTNFGPKIHLIKANLDRYHALGIKTHFTEIDVVGAGGWNQK